MVAELRKKLAEAEAIAGPAPVIGKRRFTPTHTYLTAAGRRIPVEAVSLRQTYGRTIVTVFPRWDDVWECGPSKLTALPGFEGLIDEFREDAKIAAEESVR